MTSQITTDFLPELTVFTPTYNRRHTLQRAYDSLCRQSCKQFIWLVIDDGSSDNTEELIKEFQNTSDFPIEYHYKENGGRHTAVNFSYDYLKTKYVVTLDSDDELVEDAVEKILKLWHSIAPDDYDRFWCISGREVNAANNTMVGKPWPANINELSGRAQRKMILRYPGEKHCCRKVAIHTQYKFPEYPDTKFVTENQVWEQINRKYDQYCVNDIFGKYHTESTDSISNRGVHSQTYYFSALHADVFYINELFDEILFNETVIRSIANLPRHIMLTGTSYRGTMRQLNAWYKRVIVTLGTPIGLIWMLLHHERPAKRNKKNA